MRPDGGPIAGVVEVFLPSEITGAEHVAKEDQEPATLYDPPAPDGAQGTGSPAADVRANGA